MPDDKDQNAIEPLFRNGTITVVGVVLSFSMGFLTQWASNPLPWRLSDLPTLVIISIGIVLQLLSLALLLKTDSLKRPVYERASRLFLSGVIIVGSGVFVAILVDTFRLLVQP
jgi:hypothetical protein